MEKRIPVLSLVVPVFLVWLLQGCVDVEGDEALIKATCNKTEEPDFCVAVFLANSSSLSTNLLGLATISAGVLLKNVTAAQPVVAELARNATEPLLKTTLTDCNSEYLEGIKWGKAALPQLAAKDFQSAAMSVGAVDDSALGCHDVFDQFNLTYPPILNGFQQSIFKLMEVSITIINLLIGADVIV